MSFFKCLLTVFVFLFVISFSFSGHAKTPKFQQVKAGDAALVDGYCVDYAGIAQLITAPEAEKKKCLLEKEASEKVLKLETEKVIKQIEAEHKQKMEMCELMACNKKIDKTPYGWEWLAGSVVVGVLVGVVSVLVVQNFR